MNISKQQLQNAVDNTTPEFLEQLVEVSKVMSEMMNKEEYSDMVDTLAYLHEEYDETAINVGLYHNLLKELEK